MTIFGQCYNMANVLYVSLLRSPNGRSNKLYVYLRKLAPTTLSLPHSKFSVFALVHPNKDSSLGYCKFHVISPITSVSILWSEIRKKAGAR